MNDDHYSRSLDLCGETRLEKANNAFSLIGPGVLRLENLNDDWTPKNWEARFEEYTSAPCYVLYWDRHLLLFYRRIRSPVDVGMDTQS